MTVIAADEADLAVLGEFERRLEDAPKDPRAEWRAIARPDQLLPPLGDPWRVLLLTGGRGSGKSRSGSQGLAEIILSDTEPEGQYGICAPTYRDAWTVDVEGDSGILRALGTTAGEVKHGRSRLVEYAHRSYGEIGLRNGHIIYVDSADDGALRVQGKNLRAVWCIAAGEMVVTARGEVPIERVRAGDMVATRNGWRRVSARNLTRRNAEVVKLTAEGGQTVRLTADHRVWTANRGWRMASELTPCDRISLWNQTPTNSSTGRPPTSCGTATSGITTTAPAITATRPRAAFTSPFGSTSTSSAALPVTTSTTRITTKRTITRRTSSSRRTASTLPTTITRMLAASPDGIPKGAASRRGSRGRARPASSPAPSAAVRATARGRLPSTAPTTAGKPPSSPARRTWPGSTRTRRPIPRIPSGATRRPASGSAPSAMPPTGPSQPGPSTARRTAAPRRWLRAAGRSPAPTAGRSTKVLRGTPASARSAAPGTTAKPSVRRGSASSPRNAPASTAASSTPRSSRTTPGTALSGAERLPGWQSGSLTRCPEPDGTADVYDLAVEDAHEFFAGGILVHNCDELGLWAKWHVAWDESIRYAVRKGASKIIATGTPKVSRPARALIRRLIRGEEPGVIVRRLRTVDNAANLSEAFYQSVIGAAKGTRLERQELEGELLDDVANALWTRDLLEACQYPALDGYLHQAVIGVDPSDGSEESDEQAYCVAGRAAVDDPHVYVVESWGGQESPVRFARRVILKAVEYNAKIIVEKNHGGAWLTATFDQVMRELDKAGRLPDGRKPRVETVHASQSKRTRAEPVAALYERGIVRHAGGPFVELEDSMATFTGAAGEKSPDRLDAAVWCLHPWLNHSFGPPGQAGKRQWAGSQDLGNIGVPEEARAHRRMREIHERGVQGLEDAPWSLDGFGPQDDREELARPRNNVRAWR